MTTGAALRPIEQEEFHREVQQREGTDVVEQRCSSFAGRVDVRQHRPKRSNACPWHLDRIVRVLCKTCGEHLLEVNQSHGQDDAIGVKRRAISLKRHLAQSHTRVFCKLMRRRRYCMGENSDSFEGRMLLGN